MLISKASLQKVRQMKAGSLGRATGKRPLLGCKSSSQLHRLSVGFLLDSGQWATSSTHHHHVLPSTAADGDCRPCRQAMSKFEVMSEIEQDLHHELGLYRLVTRL